MIKNNTIQSKASSLNKPEYFLVDLILYISVMFLIREVYFSSVSFIVNGLFWSFTTLIVATWRMRVRGITWRDLGLSKPESIKKTLLITGGILLPIILSIVLFNIIVDQFNLFPTPEIIIPEEPIAEQSSKFGDLKGNWWLFLTIMPMVLIESCLEELLDRGFLINWFERMFSKVGFATTAAVILQAAIFGFRHTYDISERSITVGIIGLIMGVAYVKFGRNLWPLIIAHCILNTMSMIERV
jgi:hypothetical protein